MARSPTVTERTLPTCPPAVGGANPGRSVSGISMFGVPMRSAAGAQPEPKMTAVSCAATPAAALTAWPAAVATSLWAVFTGAFIRAGYLVAFSARPPITPTCTLDEQPVLAEENYGASQQ